MKKDLNSDKIINILTICTGKYNMFFENFYNNCEKYFLNDYKKKYFVFTDGEIINSENIVKIQQNKLGWPYDTMMRFKMFNYIKQDLIGEYTFFFNVNMLIVDYIDNDILPNEDHSFLMGVRHPGYYSTNEFFKPYERRANSNFNIPLGTGKEYYQGCFNGGKTIEFLKMSSILEDKIDDDLNKNIIPIWHDESALNWYYNNINPLILDSSYAYPESIKIPFEKKIIQLNKDNYGGHNYLRN